MKEYEILLKILEKRGFKNEEDIENYINPQKIKEHDIDLIDGYQELNDIISDISGNAKNVIFWCENSLDKIIGLYFLKKCISNDVVVHIEDNNIEKEKEYIERVKSDKFNIIFLIGETKFKYEDIRTLKDNYVKIIGVNSSKTGVDYDVLFDININPGSEQSGYPFKNISVSNLCFKIYNEISKPSNIDYDKNIGLAFIGTLDARKLMKDENRLFGKKGLENILKNKSILSLVTKQRKNNLHKSSEVISSICGICRDALDDKDGKFVLNMLESSEKETYITEDAVNKVLNFSQLYQREVSNCRISLNKSDNILFDDNNFCIINTDLKNGKVLEKAIKTESYAKKKNIICRTADEFLCFCVKKCDLIEKIEEVVKTVDKNKNGIIKFNLKDGKTLNDLVTCILETVVTEEDVEETFDIELKINDVDKDLEKELLIMEPTGAGNYVARFKIENVSFRNISEFSGKSTCQVLNGSDSLNLWYYGHKTIESDWLYDVIIDSDKQLIDYVKKEYIEKEFTKGIDNRPVSVLGVTQRKVEELNKKGIYTVNELLEKTPLRYIDSRFPKKTEELFEIVDNGGVVSAVGTIQQVKYGNKIKILLECKDDDGGVFYVGWFYDWIKNSLYVGERCIFTGRLARYGKNVILYPDGLNYCGRDIENIKKLNPYYTSTKTPSNDYFKTRIKTALDYTNKEDYLEDEVIEKFGLDIRKDAFRMIHTPTTDSDIVKGQKRMVFDELFRFSINLNDQNLDKIKEPGVKFTKNNIKDTFKKIIPYKLTGDQEKAIDIITEKCNSGEKFEGLLQANVGYGKTIIAIYLAVLAAFNGFQVAVLAPTEILAKQHYNEFYKYLNRFGIKSACLAGKMTASERNKIIKEVEDGKIKVLIGTVAVANRKFNNLGVIICDEQHKFGVKQREKLYNLGNNPHYLSMSATPIPRSLAMSVYGDGVTILDLKEKPGNRPDIISLLSKSKEETNRYILDEIKNGHQVYVVCPAIEDGLWADANGVSTVKSVEKEIKELLKKESLTNEYAVLTGKTKTEDLEEIMEKFKENKISIIISTTVVEVGIDVENATLMVIKNSDRLGIAQLHQLRGRVGRGDIQSYCIFEPNDENDKRTNLVKDTLDGIKIAKEDALNRGVGDLLGTEQTGNNKIIPLIMENEELYRKINEETKEIVKNDARRNFYKEIIKIKG